jgi:predicted 3-demethylubiquinone-9 3-methyltransferase (glyoxalase superfamily)
MTAQEITPCLWFDFKAEEAVQHYLCVFGNARILATTRYGEAGPRTQRVMRAIFEMKKLDIARLRQAFGPNQEEAS